MAWLDLRENVCSKHQHLQKTRAYRIPAYDSLVENTHLVLLSDSVQPHSFRVEGVPSPHPALLFPPYTHPLQSTCAEVHLYGRNRDSGWTDYRLVLMIGMLQHGFTAGIDPSLCASNSRYRAGYMFTGAISAHSSPPLNDMELAIRQEQTQRHPMYMAETWLYGTHMHRGVPICMVAFAVCDRSLVFHDVIVIFRETDIAP